MAGRGRRQKQPDRSAHPGMAEPTIVRSRADTPAFVSRPSAASAPSCPQGLPEASMATSVYVPNIHQPDVMRSILARIVDTGDVIGAAGPGQTILAVTVDNWLIDELAALGGDAADREPENAL